MEILIVGVIVVALMVYVSTRIKRSAAEAFAEEPVETDEFALTKPENFLSPVENDEFLPFYAYSKEFGEEEGAEKLRQGLIKLKVLAGRGAGEIVREIKGSFDRVVRDERPAEDTYLITGERAEKDVEKIVYHKIVARGASVYDLELTVLADYAEKYADAARRLLESFRVK